MGLSIACSDVDFVSACVHITPWPSSVTVTDVLRKSVCCAVCAFEMRTAGGRVVFGEVKEASQAEAEYKEAVNTNKVAGLLAKSASDGVLI